MMRKFFAALGVSLILALPTTFAAAQDAGDTLGSCAEPDLSAVHEMTSHFLATADRNQLAYDAPKWAQAVESYLAAASDSAIANFRPDGLARVVSESGYVAWGGLWIRSGVGRLVWFAVSDLCIPDGGLSNGERRRAMAFVDDIGAADSSLVISALSTDGLTGISVARPNDDEPLFTVPDIEARMALRILTDISFSDAEKELAEPVVRRRLHDANATLAADLSGFPELTFCDSPDNAVRTITYMVSHHDFSSHCGGWLVLRPKRGEPTSVELTDATDVIGQPEQALLNPASWYGAIYSSIIQFRYEKKDYYALVGFKGASPTIKTRVIDVLGRDKVGNLFFGEKVFRHPKMSYRRRIFQYSAQASMTIRYDEKSQIIVMDHLEPQQRIMVGHPEYYGPDLSYDAYVLSDNGWLFQTDIQVTEADGAQPNPEVSTAADDFEMPEQGRSKRAVNVGSQQPSSSKSSSKSSSRSSKSSSSSTWSGRSSQSSRKNKSSSRFSQWFEKGRDNSAPNIRSRR